MTYVIAQVPADSTIGFECFGKNRDFFYYKGREALLSGPYETGKTMTALFKLHILLSKYLGARGLMVRKTYQSLISSAVATYEKKVLPAAPGDPKCPVEKFGGNRPDWYDYPNGARLELGGMDNPDKFLSAEFDFIYVNQAEELKLDDWEKLTGRATGRAGNSPYAQIFGDCNPGAPHHWIKHREPLKLFNSKHEDNPTLFDPVTRRLTAQGERTMETLKALTGVRFKRGFKGLWAGAEGQVYEDFDEDIHLIDRFEIPASWRRFRSIDFGYRNPVVCQWWALDEDDRLYLYREIYMSQRTVARHAVKIKEVSAGESYDFTVADHDAEDRATLAENGIPTLAAQKEISVGIEKVQERLKIQGDGRPRLFILRDSLVESDASRAEKHKPLCTLDEIPDYAYPEEKDGKNEDERPIKVDDHGMDAMRYAVMAAGQRPAVAQNIRIAPNPGRRR